MKATIGAQSPAACRKTKSGRIDQNPCFRYISATWMKQRLAGKSHLFSINSRFGQDQTGGRPTAG
jgi:hypothetical protein